MYRFDQGAWPTHAEPELGVFPITSWNSTRAVTFRVRSTTSQKFHFWIDPETNHGLMRQAEGVLNQRYSLPAYGALWEQFVEVGTEFVADSVGRQVVISIDSLRWSDGGLHPELPAAMVLEKAMGFGLSLTCNDTHYPCPPEGSATTVVVDDIRFLR